MQSLQTIEAQMMHSRHNSHKKLLFYQLTKIANHTIFFTRISRHLGNTFQKQVSSVPIKNVNFLTIFTQCGNPEEENRSANDYRDALLGNAELQDALLFLVFLWVCKVLEYLLVRGRQCFTCLCPTITSLVAGSTLGAGNFS